MWTHLLCLFSHFTKKSVENSVLTCTCQIHGSCPLSTALGSCLVCSGFCSASNTLHNWKTKYLKKKKKNAEKLRQLQSAVCDIWFRRCKLVVSNMKGLFLQAFKYFSPLITGLCNRKWHQMIYTPILQSILKVSLIHASIWPLHGSSKKENIRDSSQ